MNHWRTWHTTTKSAAETERLGGKLGRRLRGGETIDCISDLGGGKTTFVRGLVKGAGSLENVTSPTFTISQEYVAGSFTVYHFDFYRLQDAGIMTNEMAEVTGDPHAVVVAEWGDIVRDVLPEDAVRIEILASGENDRQFIFTYPEERKYLIPAESA